MLGQVFSSFGGFIGNILGGGMISTVMRFAGRTLGNYLERSAHDPDEYYHSKYHLNNLYIHADTIGKPIPVVFGRGRVAGHIIWATPISEVAENSTDIRYFRDGENVKAIHHNTTYLYYANFALALCEGIVADIGRVWINGIEKDISEYNYRFYDGSEDQMPDPLIESSMITGKTPAHRGLAYIVFENLPLAEFGGRIPAFSFEVTKKQNCLIDTHLEENIKSMVMIPGSGEFVYDTVCQEKIIYAHPDNIELYRDSINCHNNEKIADAIYSLNSLQNTCTKLEWVAPVVTWFADSLEAQKANIFPAVEYNDPSTKTTEEWNVAGINRENARLVSKNNLGMPNYGGTVNDASLVRYLRELKKRGLKIMLYPMIFLDIPGKPWRGHITGDAASIKQFFNHQNGYKNFILHYASLARGLVDAFIIGSEMKSLTKVSEDKIFPAVEELVDIARKVKSILGSEVKITYAADWSEYHHTDGGFYNLDKLWACDAIDFVGIDAYFPLTNSESSNITIDEIKNGWESGEGYDYWIDHSTGEKHSITPEWAWKNLEYWWSHDHYNSDGTKSPWAACSKKIWFTEFGFPSIDKASNQPNIFFDPNCSDGGAPRYSSSDVDFGIQRRAIKATIDFWKNKPFLERAFLWTWDARPYPAWPHGNTWSDGYMWLRGHWVNGKLGSSNLGGILLELCIRSGIDPLNVNVDTIDETVNGVVLTKQSTILDVISILRLGYFFDIEHTIGSRINFTKRGIYNPFELHFSDFVRSKNGVIELSNIAEDNMLSEISIAFPDEEIEYYSNSIYSAFDKYTNREHYYLNMPIVMDRKSAKNLAELIMNSARSEEKLIKFTVTLKYLMQIIPGRILLLNVYNNQYRVRITDIIYKNLLLEVTGVFEHQYEITKEIPYIESYVPTIDHVKEQLEVFELPESLNNSFMKVFYVGASKKASLYSMISEKTKIAEIDAVPMGVILGVHNNEDANDYLIDYVSRIKIFTKAPIDLAEGLALFGNEVIYFKTLVKISENTYELSGLIRGVSFTNIKAHEVGERFIMLSHIKEIPVSEDLMGLEIKLSAMNQEKSFVFSGMNKKSAMVRNVTYEKTSEKLKIQWKGCVKNIDTWRRACVDVIEYKIIHEKSGSKSDQTEEFFTKNEFFTLEGISADSKVAIVAMQKGFAQSQYYYI